MKAWFEQLAQREQRLVIAMSALVGIFLLYSVIWQPLNSNIATAEQKVARQQALLAWVEENTEKYKRASKGKPQSGGSLSSVVNSSARQSGINVTRMQPQGDDIQVWIDDVPFTTLLSWLESLSSSRGVMVKAIDINQLEKPGTVRVRRLHLGRI